MIILACACVVAASIKVAIKLADLIVLIVIIVSVYKKLKHLSFKGLTISYTATLRLRVKPNKPIKPVPNNQTAAGTGTAEICCA